jgi:Domain of unknown function (DUF4878)
MPARLLSPLLLALLALGLAACGATTSTNSFKGEEHAVAQAIANLQSNATALEHKKVCKEDLASSVVARLARAPGGCAKALESQLKQIDSFEATVEAVEIDGHSATAHVKSIREGKQHIETLTLVKQGGRWRISGVD